MYLNTLAYAGLPPRGSIQDRVACEMLFRMRRRKLGEVAYLGRIMSAATMLPESQYRFLTQLLSLEIFQENYMPSIIDFKHDLINQLHAQRTEDRSSNDRLVKAAQRLEFTESGLRPTTDKELEEYRRKLRNIHLKKTSRIAKPGNNK